MKTWSLSKPKDGEKVSSAVLTFFGQRLRNDLHQVVLEAFRKSDISQTELATRLNKDKGQISRLLGAPGNWTIDTFATMLFAINGHMARIDTVAVESLPQSNAKEPSWLYEDDVLSEVDTSTETTGATFRLSSQNLVAEMAGTVFLTELKSVAARR